MSSGKPYAPEKRHEKTNASQVILGRRPKLKMKKLNYFSCYSNAPLEFSGISLSGESSGAFLSLIDIRSNVSGPLHALPSL